MEKPEFQSIFSEF